MRERVASWPSELSTFPYQGTQSASAQKASGALAAKGQNKSLFSRQVLGVKTQENAR